MNGTPPTAAKRGLLAAFAVAVLVSSGGGAAAASPPAGPRVTVFGDSVASSIGDVPSATALLSKSLDLHLQLAVCRRLVDDSCPYNGVRPPTTLDVIRATGSALGSIVAVDVGYNDFLADYPDEIERVMRALVAAGVQHVIWVTLAEKRGMYATMNDEIRAAAAQWPQLSVADWNAASDGKNWFADDGLHLNAAGAMGLAELLRTAIDSACGQPCAAQVAPTRTAFQVHVPPLAADRIVSVRLPVGWTIATRSWRAWPHMAGGWLGPVGVGPYGTAWRLAVLLRPSGTTLEAILKELGSKAKGDVLGGKPPPATARWSLVRAGNVRSAAGRRQLFYALGTLCPPATCHEASATLASLLRSFAQHA